MDNFVEQIARRIFEDWNKSPDYTWEELPDYRKQTYREWVEDFILRQVSTLSLEELTAEYLMDHPVHGWFELGYAQYLTIPRSILQSMPIEWQGRFVKCLEELDDTFNWRPREGRYWVKLKDGQGRYVHDPLMDYERGRRVIKPEELEG